MRSTNATAPRSMNAAGRVSWSSADAHGVAVSRQPSYSLNRARSAWSTAPAIAASSAFACCSVTPGASRASAVNCRTLRGMRSASPPHGIHRSVPMSSSPRGITPTIDAASPPIRIARFRMSGSPPKRLCQSRWLMIATRAPPGPSSSRVKPRPSAGGMPRTGNGSSSSSPVNTRSGTSPPETLRLPRSNAARFEKARLPRISAYSAGDIVST